MNDGQHANKTGANPRDVLSEQKDSMLHSFRIRRLFFLSFALVAALAATGSEARAGEVFYPTNKLESFRIESTEKLNDLYTLRNMYVDSNNANATEGVQLFISEIRKNIYLVGNVLDIVFLYNLYKKCDDKALVKEFVYGRIVEINDNVEYNIKTLDGLADALKTRGQATLAKDFSAYNDKLVEIHSVIRDLQDSIDVPKKAPPVEKKPEKPKTEKK